MKSDDWNALTRDRNEESNFLCEFDFSAIEEADPSLEGHWQLLYDHEVPGEVRLVQNSEEGVDGYGQVGTLESLGIKITIKGPECKPTEVKIEITSETDLFLHYVHGCTEDDFEKLSVRQHLLVDMVDFPSVIMKLANQSIRAPQSYVVMLLLYPDGRGDLSFIQNVEYKFVELLRIPLRQSSEETIRRSIKYRHHILKSKLALMHARLQDVGALVKSKNPQLLKEISKCANVLTAACPPLLLSSHTY